MVGVVFGCLFGLGIVISVGFVGGWFDSGCCWCFRCGIVWVGYLMVDCLL